MGEEGGEGRLLENDHPGVRVDGVNEPPDIFIHGHQIMNYYDEEYRSVYRPKRKIKLDSIDEVIEANYSFGYHYLGLIDAFVLETVSDHEEFEKTSVIPLIQSFSTQVEPLLVAVPVLETDGNRKFNQHSCAHRAIRSAMSHHDPGIDSLRENIDWIRKENVVIIIPEVLQTMGSLHTLIMRDTAIETNVHKRSKLHSLLSKAGISFEDDDALLRYFIATAISHIAQRNYTVGNKLRKDSKKRKAARMSMGERTFEEMADRISDNTGSSIDIDRAFPIPRASYINTAFNRPVGPDLHQSDSMVNATVFNFPMGTNATRR
jgi:hypothetical protein